MNSGEQGGREIGKHVSQCEYICIGNDEMKIY